MNSKRIAMLAPFGIRPKGTLSARMLPLAQALVQRGHTVEIIAPPVQNPQDAGRRDVYHGVSVTHTALPTLSGPAGVAQQVFALLRSALMIRPDVLHLFKPKGYSGLAALLARRLCPALPLVVDSDDWEGWGGWNELLPYPQTAKQLFAWQERDLPRRATAVTVASRTLETQMWGFGVQPERVFYVPNGVLSSEFSGLNAASVKLTHNAQRTTHTLLLYTRFWEFDVHAIVAALVIIAQRCPQARLLVVGRGERGEEQTLLRLAQRAGVATMIDYRGWVDPEAIPALLALADVALAPTNDTLINRARCSAKLLELMATGLPVVASRVGEATTYIEDEQNGLLVAPGDVAAFAQATLRLLGDVELRVRLGASARKRAVENFSWERLANTVETAYWKIVCKTNH